MIASAFHPPYGEKMLTTAERAGFAAAIIVRNGIEGTIAFPLLRSAKILCSKRINGQYVRHAFDIDPQKYLNEKPEKEEVLEQPSLDENIRLLQKLAKQEKTDNRLFDNRVKLTCLGLDEALAWIQNG